MEKTSSVTKEDPVKWVFSLQSHLHVFLCNHYVEMNWALNIFIWNEYSSDFPFSKSFVTWNFQKLV